MPTDPRRILLLETDPLRRASIAVATRTLSREDFTDVIADALAALRPGARHALACLLLESGEASRLYAAVAEQAAALYARVVTPLDIHESVGHSDPRFRAWQRIAPALASLPADDPEPNWPPTCCWASLRRRNWSSRRRWMRR